MKKYICKENFEINDIEDVEGYCDIKNLNTNQVYNAAWMDGDDTLEPVKMKATCIEWDTDGEDVSLPTEIEIPEGMDTDDIEDYLSDVTGFCHNGYVLEPSI